MSFLIPPGLLGLTSILVLILIYIIKPKYHDKAVSSTFIWKLSLKYKKPRMPFEWLKRSLLLFLQLLILTSLALMLARPFVTLDSISGEKVVVLDASASMMAKDGSKTRFEKAVDEILDLVDDKQDEDRVTVILAGEEPTYLIRRADSAARIRAALSDASCSMGEGSIEAALELANSVLEENNAAEVILYTDHDYEQPGYVTVENISKNEWNAAVLNIQTELKSGYYAFTADVASYGKNTDLEVSLYVDDAWRLTKKVSLTADTVTQVTFWDEPEVSVVEYAAASIRLDVKDSYAYDNILFTYGSTRPRYVELISEHPHLLNMALMSDTRNSVYQASMLPKPQIYTEGYDLYVYEGILPKALPKDGSVLLINPEGSVFGLRLTDTVKGNFKASAAGGISGTYQQLMKGIDPTGISISQYRKVSSTKGYEVIMRCNGDPVMLAKEEKGVRVVVLAFDLHYSDLPLLLDFPLLIHNMCEYTAPPTLEKSLFDVGETVTVHVKPNTESVQVKFEGRDGGEDETTDYTAFPLELTADQPGVYTVTQKLTSGKVRTDTFFVRTSAEESDFSAVGGVLAAEEYQGGNGNTAGNDVRYNIFEFFKIIAIALLVLLVVEWGVQYREQF